MPVSTTSARISAVVPDAHALNSTQLAQVFSGARAANINHAVVHVRWNLVQPNDSLGADMAASGLSLAIHAAGQAGVTLTLVPTGPIPAWVASKPSMVADYIEFVKKVALYARNQSLAWGFPQPLEYQVWHWPNLAESWGAAPDPAEYTAMIRAAYPALRAVNPNIRVVFGSLAPVTTAKSVGRVLTRARKSSSTELTPASFLTSAYDAKVKGFFDAVGYTPVSITTPQQPKPPAPSGDSIRQSDALRAVMVSKGDAAKKMHWTVGYDTDLFTQTQQALYLDTLLRFAEVRRDHVAAFNLYTYRDLA